MPTATPILRLSHFFFFFSVGNDRSANVFSKSPRVANSPPPTLPRVFLHVFPPPVR